MNIKIIRDFKTLLWKNGLGSTEEMLIHPNDADVNQNNFEYRMSSATVTGESEFSFFKGYRRLLVLLNGALTLTHSDSSNGNISQIELQDFVPHFFSGDDLTVARVAGTEKIRDFNFIFLPDKFRVRCDILNENKDISLYPEKTYFLFSPESTISIGQKNIMPSELGIMSVVTKKTFQIVTSSRTILIELGILGRR